MSVDEHHERHVRRRRPAQRGVGLVPLVGLAPGGDDFRSFRNEQVDDADALVEQATSIAPKVEHQPLHAGGIPKGHQGLAHLSGRTAGEFGEVDVARAVVEHAGIGDGRNANLGPLHLEFESPPAIGAVDADGHRTAGFALKQVGDGLGVHVRFHLAPVDVEDDVSRTQARLVRRVSFVDLHNRHPALHRLDEGANAPVFARVHEPDVLDPRFGIVDGVGVQLVEHGVDGHAHQGARLGLLHVKLMHAPKDGSQDLEVLGDFEVGAGGQGRPDAEDGKGNGHEDGGKAGRSGAGHAGSCRASFIRDSNRSMARSTCSWEGRSFPTKMSTTANWTRSGRPSSNTERRFRQLSRINRLMRLRSTARRNRRLDTVKATLVGAGPSIGTWAKRTINGNSLAV